MGTLYPLIRMLKIDARDVFNPELKHESSTKRALRVQMESCNEQEAAALIPVVETILKTLRTKNAEP